VTLKFDIFKVGITLTEPLLGTVPKDPKVYASYIASKAPDPKLGSTEVETVPEADESAEKIERAGWTGFHRDDRGYFLYDYAILGFLKEAGNVLKEQLKITNLRSKIDQLVFIEPRRIYLTEGHPDLDVLERPLRCMTMQGPRVTVVRSDCVPEGTSFEIKIKILENEVSARSKSKSATNINREVIDTLLQYGQFKGLGQFRNGSYGRFEYKIKDLGEQSAAS
jgi:hypothetical protein